MHLLLQIKGPADFTSAAIDLIEDSEGYFDPTQLESLTQLVCLTQKLVNGIFAGKGVQNLTKVLKIFRKDIYPQIGQVEGIVKSKQL